jgi:hypothetical protein
MLGGKKAGTASPGRELDIRCRCRVKGIGGGGKGGKPGETAVQIGQHFYSTVPEYSSDSHRWLRPYSPFPGGVVGVLSQKMLYTISCWRAYMFWGVGWGDSRDSLCSCTERERCS